MAFSRSMYFIAAYGDAGSRVFLFKQTSPSTIQWDAATPAGDDWTPTGATLHQADDTAIGFGVDSATLASLFTVVRTGDGGAGTIGTVDLDVAGLATVDFRDTLLGVFTSGGRVKLQVTVDGAIGQALEVELRALKTTRYRLSGNVAQPAYHVAPGSGNNLDIATALAVGDAIGSYCADLGGLVVVGMTASDLTLDPAGHAPADSATRNLEMVITHSAFTGESRMPVDLHVPTELVVLLDRSGSMGASTSTGNDKWTEARIAANLLSRLYADLVPQLSSPNGDILSQNSIALGHFRWSGGADVGFGAGLVPATTKPEIPDTVVQGGATPIGVGIVGEAAPGTVPGATSLFTSNRWKQRHIVLLTDGMDNTGNPRLDDLTDMNPLSAGNDVDRGVVIHNISYTQTGDMLVADIAALVSEHDGFYDDTTTATVQALDPDDLKDMFLSVLSSILPVEKADALTPLSIPLEDGIERAIFVATRPPAGAIQLEAHLGAVDATTAAGKTADVAWAIVDRPAAGTYSVANAPAGAKLFALFDLTTRVRCSASASGVGQPIHLVAELRHHGVPISGANVRATKLSPGASLGEVLTGFVKRGGLTSAVRRRLLDPAALKAAQAAALGQASADVKSVQRQLLAALERLENVAFTTDVESIALREVSPGRYEATVPPQDTVNENVYTFKFRAMGVTPRGHEFQRDHRLSVVLPAVADPTQSEASLSSTKLANGKTQWTATVLPRTATGKPLGPGLVPLLSYQHLDPADRKRFARPVIVDNLDGTYRTVVATDTDQAPKLGLYSGRPDRGARPVVVAPKTPRVRKVSVRLDKIQVLDDKDPLLFGPGELVFFTHVAPNGSPSRTVGKRLPAQGHFSVSSGQCIEIGEVIYRGFVEAGASLVIGVAGKELDWPRCFALDDELTRYVRCLRLPEVTRQMTPGDETNDPEALRDWKLWYTVDVD
ncbi:MAG: hypothetical protein JW751_18810 [Polyangiaceae bacterium]|nr:hypothetical protein [Polyangiaceae bacterium]